MGLIDRITNAVVRRAQAVRKWGWPAEGAWRRTPDDLWMFLKPGDFFDALYAFGAPDEGFRQIVRRIVRPGDWAIDVGGQKGWNALLLWRAVGPSGRVLTVEADPNAADLLQANLDRNGASNVTLARALAGDTNGTATFHINEVIGWSSLTPNAQLASRVKSTVQLPMRTLDDMFAELHAPPGARVTFMKLDIEGAEPGALRGAARILREHRPVLWIEINPSLLAAAGSSPAALADLLEPLGYQFWRGHGTHPTIGRPYAWFIRTHRLADVTEEMDVIGIPPALMSEWQPRLDAAPHPRSPLK